ncbi:ubiquitin carboxyl-terminal hydrolase 16-like [Cynara cardunculus var. scolymus]|uniref:ubiquitinyl hydrolase 1 n=1 Tax=Cynara cardunculus var. scolymus TaxID=59895 RepID=A0A103YCV6_CYNCS|nr:ubiquitin carboxyl-terminal hydrolase 16-like [Cynara cardunculus var. scolymus]KVI06756.1 Peptidase C19, ubiquitin carboxyl-terminal hydrolase 2 [Cynara cardunculus var. scolymus]
MLVGRDLGLPNLVVLVVVFLIVPAIGFVIRRKWLHAEARREEIKRLLVLASEEAARAEIEATEGYFYTANTSSSVPAPDSAWIPAPDSAWVPTPESARIPPTTSVPLVSALKPPYQCAVCFSPTSTRCAKCKAVRYCSGRCQIVHWRQGHKDQCRPYVAVNPIKDVSGSSKQGNDKDSDDNLPGENFHEGMHHKDDAGIQSHAHRPETRSIFQSASESSCEEFSTFSTPNKSSTEASSDSSGDSDRMDAHQFVDAVSGNSVTVKSGHQSLVSPGRKSTGSRKINQNKSNLSDEDTQSRVSSSSSRGDGGSNGSSFSEPSTTSSGFWSGVIHSKKSSIDERDGFELSSSNGVANGNMTDSRSSLGLSSKVTTSGYNSTSMKGVAVTSTVLDNSAPNGLGSKKSNEEPTSSNELLMDGLKSTRQPKYTPEMLKHTDVVVDSDLPRSMFKEAKVSPSGAGSQYASGAGEHSTIKYSKAFGGMPSASLERSNHVFNNKSSISPASESIRVRSSLSKASDTHLTSSTSRPVSQSPKPVMVHDEKNRAVACSSKLTENSESARNGLKTSMLKVVDQLKPSKLSRHCSVRAESETAHRYSCKVLFSYEMFVKLYNWKKVEMQPFGLINCGNSCYANAVLQCLTYTPPLNAYFLEGFHSKTCDKREWCFACEFEGLVLKAKDGTSPLSPIRILSQIENIGSNLGHGREEDAHEFLRYAIDTLQSVCLKEAGTNSSNPLEEETTLIGLTFGGYLRSKIKCMKCGGKSERHERMMDLTVEIEGDIRTLEEALDKFTCNEILDGENKYKCSRCKSYEKAKKKLTLLEAPNVLTIALKRFQSGKFGKLNKPIHFPEILDMAPYVSGTSDKLPIYRLYGVVVHVDVMNAAFSGHYVCYVKNVENRWFKIDDSRVKEVDLQSVLTKGAYMLLYARCSPRAPRLVRSLLMRHHHDPKKHKGATLFASRPQPTEAWDINQPAIRHRSLEEESSSSDSSGIFSESCSCSTESSHRDSSDHISWDWEHECWNNSSPPWRSMHLNSSDSDTSSSSSSFPSPLYSRNDHNTSREPGVLYPDDDQCRNLSCSNSCREANVDRLGGRPVNPSENSKPTLRRSTTRGK